MADHCLARFRVPKNKKNRLLSRFRQKLACFQVQTKFGLFPGSDKIWLVSRFRQKFGLFPGSDKNWLLSRFRQKFGFFPGYTFDHGHLTRAISQRVTDDLNDLYPPGYQSNYPYVGRVTNYNMAAAQADPAMMGVNWSLGDTKLEIVDGATGKIIEQYVVGGVFVDQSEQH